VTLPASRTIRSGWSIPSDPGLVGIELFVQSMRVDTTARLRHLTGFWTATIRR